MFYIKNLFANILYDLFKLLMGMQVYDSYTKHVFLTYNGYPVENKQNSITARNLFMLKLNSTLDK